MRMILAQPLLDGLDLPNPAKKAAKRRRKPVKLAGPPVQPRYDTSVDEQGRRVWTLHFPAPTEMISVNQKAPWQREYRARKTIRDAMASYAKAAKLPVGLARIRIDLELHFTTGTRRDQGTNFHDNVAKPIGDALGPPFISVDRTGKVSSAPGHRMVADDTGEFVDGPHVTIGPKCTDRRRTPYGEIMITITDLSNDPVNDADRPTP